ncbi:MAG: CHAT domain-containing protein [Candidatus Eisenbacteria bacterium]|nr:CHAT domain-containing protein [Candidatus Eisenbacteria bacterium]
MRTSPGSRRDTAQPSAADLLRRVDELRRSRPDRALELLGAGFPGAVRAAAPSVRGELWRLRGHVLRGLRRTSEAAAAYRRARDWFRRAGQPREEGRCAIGLVDSLMYLGHYDEARREAARGRGLLQRSGDRVSLARLLNNEGNLHHRLDRPDRAMERYRGARRALARAGDTRGAALVDGNIGNCLSLLGRCDEARTLYRRARAAHARRGYALDALNGDYSLAYLDFLEHRHERALEGLARVREQARDSGSPSLSALSALDRAEILLRLGAHERALEEALRAAEECGALTLKYEQAKAETFAALAEFRLGREGAARARLERTLAAFHAEGNLVWAGESLVGYATVWWRAGNPRAAAALLSAARRRFARAGDSEREGCSLALLARALLEGGERRRAAACLARLRGPGRRPASPRLRHLALAAEAGVARAAGDLAAARRFLRRAARESERLAARVLDEQWRSTFWGEWGWPHRELAALELEQGRVAEALEALEGGRGRALVGPTARGGGRGGEIPGKVRAWAAARMARERERTARSGEAVPEATPAGRRPVEPGPESPALRRALRAAPRMIRAAALQKALPQDVLLIDYLLHRGSLGAITAGRHRLSGRLGMANEAQVTRLVHSLLFQLRSATFSGAGAPGPAGAPGATLAELAALALWPALGPSLPAGLPRGLAVAPVGPLARLPWAALPLPDGRALCEAMSLVVVPGLRLGLAGARTASPTATSPPLIVAADAGELENVEPETRALLREFPQARLLAGAEATAERFLDLAPRAEWIHFAGHGH